jgi:hypothetical protein
VDRKMITSSSALATMADALALGILDRRRTLEEPIELVWIDRL